MSRIRTCAWPSGWTAQPERSVREWLARWRAISNGRAISTPLAIRLALAHARDPIATAQTSVRRAGGAGGVPRAWPRRAPFEPWPLDDLQPWLAPDLDGGRAPGRPAPARESVGTAGSLGTS